MRKLLLAATALLVLGGTANAAVFEGFNPPGVGDLGTSATFTAPDGTTIKAYGFTDATLSTATDLYFKNSGGDETGLGLTVGSDHEITGKEVIVVDTGAARAAGDTQFRAFFNSLTGGEDGRVLGQNSNSITGAAFGSIGDDNILGEGRFNLIDDRFYEFASVRNVGGDNVLIGGIEAVAAVPEPSTWAMMLLGFAGIVVMGARARRRGEGSAFRLV